MDEGAFSIYSTVTFLFLPMNGVTHTLVYGPADLRMFYVSKLRSVAVRTSVDDND